MVSVAQHIKSLTQHHIRVKLATLNIVDAMKSAVIMPGDGLLAKMKGIAYRQLFAQVLHLLQVGT